MGKTILFSPIGGTDPIKYFHDGSMLHICRKYKPDIVYLYLSKEMLENHIQDNRYVETLRLLGESIDHTFDINVIERAELCDVQQYDVFYMDFREIIRAIELDMQEDDRLIINMASGTPAMKSALMVMATLAEYRFVPVQVSTPQKRINAEYEDRTEYDIKANWELNEDNENYIDRCQEVKCMHLVSMLKIDIIKKLILAYDYTSALSLAYTIKQDLSEEVLRLLEVADARYKLDYKTVGKLLEQKYKAIIPIKDSNKQKIFEYVLTLELRLKKQEYSDFVRAITPVIVDLFEMILKNQCGFNIDDVCTVNWRTSIKEWDLRKLKEKNLMRIMDETFAPMGFKAGPVYSSGIEPLIMYLSQDPDLKEKIKSIRSVEKNIRNMAAHNIVSISDDVFVKMTGKTSKQIMDLLKYLVVKAGINVKEDQWNSYDYMNKVIIDCLDN